jgi:hypothetical protein
VVLTGHWTTARPWPDPTGAELAVLRGGAINSGVVGVGAGAEQMLDWWAARLTRDCVLDYDRGLFLDQLWLSEVPTIFRSTVLRDAGVNASLLSLFDGDVEWSGETPSLHGAPVRLWHFLGAFDPHAPEALAGEPWLRQFIPYVASRPGAHRLARDYAQRLLDNGYDAVALRKYAYAQLPGELVLEPAIRVIYREALIESELGNRAEPPNPLLVGAEPFLDWLASPVEGHTVPRYLLGHYRVRPDVRMTFPAVPGEDSERLMDWAPGAVLRGEIAPPNGLLERLPVLAGR